MVKPAEISRLRHGYLSSPEEIVDEAKNGRADHEVRNPRNRASSEASTNACRSAHGK